jgi:hypothetical protein
VLHWHRTSPGVARPFMGNNVPGSHTVIKHIVGTRAETPVAEHNHNCLPNMSVALAPITVTRVCVRHGVVSRHDDPFKYKHSSL